MWIKLHGPMNGLDRGHLRLRQSAFSGNICGEFVRNRSCLQEGRRVADGGRLGKRNVIILGKHSLETKYLKLLSIGNVISFVLI